MRTNDNYKLCPNSYFAESCSYFLLGRAVDFQRQSNKYRVKCMYNFMYNSQESCCARTALALAPGKNRRARSPATKTGVIVIATDKRDAIDCCCDFVLANYPDAHRKGFRVKTFELRASVLNHEFHRILYNTQYIISILMSRRSYKSRGHCAEEFQQHVLVYTKIKRKHNHSIRLLRVHPTTDLNFR